MSSSPDLLSGVALLTGGGSGIGRSTCAALVSHGVRRLAILDIDAAGAEETAKGLKDKYADLEVLVLHTDMANEESIVTSIGETIKVFGRIDYAINNAGTGGALAPSTDVSNGEFRTAIDINLVGLWVGQREEIRHMLKQEPLSCSSGIRNRGVIVNMSSMLGLVGTSSATPAASYCASKHGIIAVTKCDANFYGPENIRINAICPGYVGTAAMLDALSQSEVMKAELQKVPLRRFAKVEEIAEGICFLVSPMSSYMNGAAMVMDGGYTSQ